MSADENNPYKNHTLEDVRKAESNYFYIQLGHDVLTSENGKMAFNKQKAELLFEKTKAGLYEMLDSGSDDEATQAFFALQNLRLIPLRIN